MSSRKIAITLVAVTIVAVSLGIGATWWFLRDGRISAAGAAAASQAEAERDERVYKYVSLDKIIVMLRGEEGEAEPHYLAVDLVFKSPAEQERKTVEQLPFLRSIAVKALSPLTMSKASRMTVDELTEIVNTAYAQQYTTDRQEPPFVTVMIGKLLVE
jgi:flagellar FliL protein